jgi:hypothetical protein
LCNKSEFFRKKLQPKRKPFDDNTDCKELTYCTAHCGNNFHYKCMERWKDAKRAAGEAVKCPFCRHTWAAENNMTTVHRLPKISATAFSIFSDWLYHTRIVVEDVETGFEEHLPNMVALVTAYVLGLHLKHSTFYQAVMEALLETAKDTSICPGPVVIGCAYENTRKGSVLRHVIVRLFAQRGQAKWRDMYKIEGYPVDFLKDLVSALLKQQPSLKDTLDLSKMKEEFGAKEVFEEDYVEENAEQRSDDEPSRTRGDEYPVTDSDSDSDPD